MTLINDWYACFGNVGNILVIWVVCNYEYYRLFLFTNSFDYPQMLYVYFYCLSYFKKKWVFVSELFQVILHLVCGDGRTEHSCLDMFLYVVVIVVLQYFF